MPLYEYKCECGFEFERTGKVEDSVQACPQCGKKARRQISQCSFHLKGKGWYASDRQDEKVLEKRAKRNAGVE